jgi:hypothetical protein
MPTSDRERAEGVQLLVSVIAVGERAEGVRLLVSVIAAGEHAEGVQVSGVLSLAASEGLQVSTVRSANQERVT